MVTRTAGEAGLGLTLPSGVRIEGIVPDTVATVAALVAAP